MFFLLALLAAQALMLTSYAAMGTDTARAILWRG